MKTRRAGRVGTVVRWTTALVAVAVVSGGAAWSAASDDAVVHACATKSRGTMRLVAGPSDCKANEHHVAWNQQGPAGPPGPSGAAITSLDDLAGTDCNRGWAGDGVLEVRYEQDGLVSLECAATATRVLTVTVEGEGRVFDQRGRIDCPGDCTERYLYGDVELVVEPAPGWHLDHVGESGYPCWEREGIDARPEIVCVVGLSEDRTETFVFVRDGEMGV